MGGLVREVSEQTISCNAPGLVLRPFDLAEVFATAHEEHLEKMASAEE